MVLELVGYFVICVIALFVTAALLIGLFWGGVDLDKAPAKAWVIVLPILLGGWYWVLSISPFEVVMK